MVYWLAIADLSSVNDHFRPRLPILRGGGILSPLSRYTQLRNIWCRLNWRIRHSLYLKHVTAFIRRSRRFERRPNEYSKGEKLGNGVQGAYLPSISRPAHFIQSWDQFRAYTTESTKKLLKWMNTEIVIIPWGLKKPLDVCINKPFKIFIEKCNEWVARPNHVTYEMTNNFTSCILLKNSWEAVKEMVIK